MEKILCPVCYVEMEADGTFWECMNENCYASVSGPMTEDEKKMFNPFDWLRFCEEEYKDRPPLQEGIPEDDYLRLQRAVDLFGGAEAFQGKRIAEIGSQDGFFSMILRLLGGNVTAIDMISKWIRYGYEHDKVGVHWIIGLGEYLPFHDQIFDMIFLGEVLEHTVDPERILQEAQRISKPGAMIVITVPWVVVKESTHLHDWPSFKWRGIIEKYVEIDHTEIFRDRWFIVLGRVENQREELEKLPDPQGGGA